jgi:hypothetical protein
VNEEPLAHWEAVSQNNKNAFMVVAVFVCVCVCACLCGWVGACIRAQAVM